MPPKSWKDYVPRYVSLYYVDYNENLDSREDLTEKPTNMPEMKKA